MGRPILESALVRPRMRAERTSQLCHTRLQAFPSPRIAARWDRTIAPSSFFSIHTGGNHGCILSNNENRNDGGGGRGALLVAVPTVADAQSTGSVRFTVTSGGFIIGGGGGPAC